MTADLLFSGTLALSWPTRILWPNGRGHWARKHAAFKAQKYEAWGAALDAGLRKQPPGALVRIDLTFQPPYRVHTFDLDNAEAAVKAALDGLSGVLGIDDSLFTHGQKSRLDRRRGLKGAALITVTITAPEIKA